jgi:mycothiol synthase
MHGRAIWGKLAGTKGTAMGSPDIAMVPADQARRLLRRLLAVRGQSPAELERQVTAFLEYARAMSLDLSRQWAYLDGEDIVVAAGCLESPGRTAVLFLRDGSLVEGDVSIVDRLVGHVVAEESARDVRLLQCLVHPRDTVNAGVLRRASFREIATLRYLERNMAADETAAVKDNLPPALLGRPLEWRTYEDARHDSFAELILATYRDSLDCPALTGLRHIDDIIAGHKAVGRFQPEHWLLLECGGEAAGCVLLVESPVRRALELTYMGVHPNWRGRGVGRVLLGRGLGLARCEEYEAVTLAVDAGNVPAVRLYDSFGFRETARRRAWVRPLSATSCAT